MRDAFETVSAAIIRRLSSQTGPLPPLSAQQTSYAPTGPSPNHRPETDRSTSFDNTLGVPAWANEVNQGTAHTGTMNLNMENNYVAPYGTGGVEVTPGLIETLESFFSNPYTDLSAFQGVDFSLDGLFGDMQPASGT